MTTAKAGVMVPAASSAGGTVVLVTQGGCCGSADRVCYGFMAARGGGAAMSITGSFGPHRLSDCGNFAPRVLASNHGCLESFGGLENRRNGFLAHALSITLPLNESTKCLCK
ncbi:unnamed protein product [Prunus brigantina]